MNEVIVQDDRYPEWMKAWNAKAAEMDEQIITYLQANSQQTVEAMDNIVRQLYDWWDRQQMEPAARAEYEKAKADEARFRAQLDERVRRLAAEDRSNTNSPGQPDHY